MLKIIDRGYRIPKILPQTREIYYHSSLRVVQLHYKMARSVISKRGRSIGTAYPNYYPESSRDPRLIFPTAKSRKLYFRPVISIPKQAKRCGSESGAWSESPQSPGSSRSPRAAATSTITADHCSVLYITIVAFVRWVVYLSSSAGGREGEGPPVHDSCYWDHPLTTNGGRRNANVRDSGAECHRRH